MRKCDWCRNNPECRGVKVSECIVRDYRNFVPYENGGTCRGNRAKMSIYEDAIGMCESCIHKKYVDLKFQLARSVMTISKKSGLAVKHQHDKERKSPCNIDGGMR